MVLEKDKVVGGISRTVNYKGYHFDIGGHRFFTKVKAVDEMWHEVLAERTIPATQSSFSNLLQQEIFLLSAARDKRFARTWHLEQRPHLPELSARPDYFLKNLRRHV